LGGISLRRRPFCSDDVPLHLDLAAGKDDHAVYVRIAEAFQPPSSALREG
jgi:hypothetical protein